MGSATPKPRRLQGREQLTLSRTTKARVGRTESCLKQLDSQQKGKKDGKTCSHAFYPFRFTEGWVPGRVSGHRAPRPLRSHPGCWQRPVEAVLSSKALISLPQPALRSSFRRLAPFTSGRPEHQAQPRLLRPRPRRGPGAPLTKMAAGPGGLPQHPTTPPRPPKIPIPAGPAPPASLSPSPSRPLRSSEAVGAARCAPPPPAPRFPPGLTEGAALLEALLRGHGGGSASGPAAAPARQRRRRPTASGGARPSPPPPAPRPSADGGVTAGAGAAGSQGAAAAIPSVAPPANGPALRGGGGPRRPDMLGLRGCAPPSGTPQSASLCCASGTVLWAP